MAYNVQMNYSDAMQSYKNRYLFDRYDFNAKSNPLQKYAVHCSEGQLDLNEKLINKPGESFLIRVTGDSMINAGIREGDLLVVDRSKEVKHNKIVVAEYNGTLLVKRYKNEGGRVCLQPENSNYPVINIDDNDNFRIWGVVTSVIRTLN